MAVKIFDTTLRDGEQSPGVALTPMEKLEIAKSLERLGVDVIEAGFPITSEGDFEAVAQIAATVQKATVCALARTLKKDIDRAGQALVAAPKRRIHVFTSTSDIHLKYMIRKTKEDIKRDATEAIEEALRYTDDVEFSFQDATRSDIPFLEEMLALVIKAGATTINIPDTVGYAVPSEFGRLIARLSERAHSLGDVTLSVHCHNDLGLAVANSLAAVENGARQIECAINGIGERAGNAALEEIVMALRTRQDVWGESTNVDTKELLRVSRLVASKTGMAVQPNKAIIGANAFAHEAGIHQDGFLKERSTYEIMRPTDVGYTQTKLVLGKHSGRHAFRDKVLALGFNLEDAELDQLFSRFKALADRKKEISEADLEAMLQMDHSGAYDLELLSFQVSSGTTGTPMASVVLRIGQETISEAAIGDGPVDAVCRAIGRAARIDASLVEYTVKAVTGGPDALGEATMRASYDGQFYVGRGLSSDVIEASAKAWTHALNKIIRQRKTAEAEVLS